MLRRQVASAGSLGAGPAGPLASRLVGGWLDGAAVTVDDRTYAVADAVLHGYATGAWPRMVDDLARRVDPPPVDTAALGAATVAFRRRRRLLAAAEHRAWLAARDLDDAALRAHLRRAAAPAADEPAAPEVVAPLLHEEAVLSGTLERLAWSLGVHAVAGTAPVDPARRATVLEAVAADRVTALGLPDLEARVDHLLGHEAAHAALAAQDASPEAIEACLREHALAWTAYALTEVVFTTVGAAREGALCVRHDGTALADLAHRLALPLADRTVAGEQLPADEAPLLLAARPAEVVGPLGQGPWRLVEVRSRTTPQAADPAAVARARETLLERAAARRTAGRVRLHGL